MWYSSRDTYSDDDDLVTNYRLHLVYTVFYLYSIRVIELMHVSIIVQPTLYITVLHKLTHPS